MANIVGKLRDIVEAASDPKAALLKELGDISDQRVLHSQVLVATFAGSKYHPGTSILRTDRDLQEQQFQGSIALIIALGPTAFKYDGQFPYEGPKPVVGDWVLVRPSDGLQLSIRQVPCRLFDSDLIRMVVADPSLYW